MKLHVIARIASPAFAAGLVCTIGLFAAASNARAQAPSDGDTAPQAAPAAAQAAPAAPKTPTWSATASFNFMRQLSNIDLKTYSVNGASAFRQQSKTQFFLYGDMNYGTVAVGGAPQVQADSDHLRFIASHTVNPRLYYMGSIGYKRNAVQGVDYSIDQLAGVGLRFEKPRRAIFDVAGVAGALEQQKNLPATDGTNFTFGALQTSMLLHGDWVWKETLMYMQNSKDHDDYRLQLSLALTGKIVGPVGFSFGYQLDRENLVLLNETPTTSTTTFGLTLTLPWVRSPSAP